MFEGLTYVPALTMEYRFLAVVLSLAFWTSGASKSTCKKHVHQNFVLGVKTVLLTENNSTCKRNYFMFDNMLADENDIVEIHYTCTPQPRWLSGRRVFLTLPQGKEVCTDRWDRANNSNCFAYTRTGNCSTPQSNECTLVTLNSQEVVRIFNWRTDLLKFTISYKLSKCTDDDGRIPSASESPREENHSSRSSSTDANPKNNDSSSAKWCRGDDGQRIPHTKWEHDGFPYNCIKTRSCPSGLVQETTGRCEKTCFQALTRLGGRFSCKNKCICPRGRYRNENGQCVEILNCQNFSNEVEATTPSYSDEETTSGQRYTGLSTELTLAIAATIFLIAILFGIGLACWRKKRNTRGRDNIQSGNTDNAIWPYAETTVTAAGYKIKSVINGPGQGKVTSPYESLYIEPETLPSKSASGGNPEYINQDAGSSTPFHQYEPVQPIRSAGRYLQPIRRPSVEEASAYQLTTGGYVNDSGYLEIDFESKAE